jgi:subtilisin family serine protease
MMYRASPNVLPPTDKLECRDFGRENVLWFCLLVFLVLVRTGLGVEAPLPGFVPGQILVKPKAHVTDAEFSKRLAAHRATHRKTLQHISVRIINVPEDRAEAVLSALRNDPEIEFAERDGIARAAFVPNDSYVVSGNEWHLQKIQAPQAWDYTAGAPNTIIAILDSGINSAHPDLAGRVLPGYDFVSDNSDPADDFGHGTAVAGTAVAAGNNNIGVAGVAFGCAVLPVKVVDSSGFASYSCVAQGIKYAVDHGARVINLSIAGDTPSSTLQSAIDYAWSNNVVVVAAAGNNGDSTPQYPAACAHVVGVSATEPDDSLATFSSYGSFVALAAPGDNIWTTQRDLSNPYGAWRGTSFASPIVASAAALIAAANPTLSNTQIVSVLETAADDLGLPGYDPSFGFGRVNAFRAVALATSEPGSILSDGSDTNHPPTGQATNSTRMGHYAGLIADPDGVRPDTSGYLALTVRHSGAFSGKVLLGGARYGFGGQFNSAGRAQLMLSRRLMGLTVTLYIDPSNGTDQLSGAIDNGAWTSEIAGNRNVFNPRLNPALQTGLRSFTLQQVDNPSGVANGMSRIFAGGNVSVRGHLGDGRPFILASTLAKNGDFPFYLSLHHGAELVIGWLDFPAGAEPAAGGSVVWLNTGTNAFARSLQVSSSSLQ